MKAKTITLIAAVILCIGCQVKQRPQKIVVRPPRIETKQQRIRRWEALAYQLKIRHPEWKQSIKEIAAELEYQWELLEKEK